MRWILAGVATAAVFAAPAAMAQDYTLSPNYGQVTLRAGFADDPHTVSMTAGGTIDVARTNSSCRGRVSNAPDYQVNYTAGSTFPLIFRVDSASDTTLLINGPSASWVCDDDSGGDLNPEVRFDSPQSGRYDIWVGTYGDRTAPATLYVSELSSSGGYDGGSSAYNGVIDPSLTAYFGEVYLDAGFTPDPHRISITAGGSINTSTAATDCRGQVSAAPDYQITYRAGSLPLSIRTDSSTDTTLLVSGPRGEWYCDDDSAGSRNAEVRLVKPASGVYDIWVGTYGGGTASADLIVTERR